MSILNRSVKIHEILKRLLVIIYGQVQEFSPS